MKPETRYFLRRASEEARRAIVADQPGAADAHEELSLRYSVKALDLLDEADNSPGPPSPEKAQQGA